MNGPPSILPWPLQGIRNVLQAVVRIIPGQGAAVEVKTDVNLEEIVWAVLDSAAA